MQRFALVGAMEIEIHAYCEKAQNIYEVHEGNFSFYEGELFGRNVVIASCGQGKVLTALTTQKIIDKYHPTAVILTGVAGSLKPELKVGDVVISQDCAQHDLDVTILGFPRGMVPDTHYHFINADANLISLAMQTKLDGHQLVKGRILSGDQFFTEEETLKRDYLFNELEGSAIEMEGAALALVCAFNKVPFIVTRTICSELEGNQEEQYRASLIHVVNNSLRVVESILKQN